MSFSGHVWATTDLFSTTWNDLIAQRIKDKSFPNDPAIKNGLGYCYLDPNTGEIQGQGTNKLIKLASISKIFTSLVTLNVIKKNEKLHLSSKTNPKDFIFTTSYKVYQSVSADGKTHFRLNIVGGYDPYFDLRKLIWSISLLNQEKIFLIDEIIFSEAFFLLPTNNTDDSFLDPEKAGYIGPFLPDSVKTQTNIKKYFNVANIPRAKKIFQNLKQLSSTLPDYILGINKQNAGPVMQVKKVTFSNSFAPNKDEKLFINFSLFSSATSKIIKFMNTYSHNWVAEALFQYIGKKSNYDQELKSLFGENITTEFYSGSGLPTFKENSRQRNNNKATCDLVLLAMQKLVAEEFQNISFPVEIDKNIIFPLEFLGSTGEGTLKDYLPGKFFVGKSGTVNDAMNLAIIGPSSLGKINFFMFSNLPNERYFKEHLDDLLYDSKLTKFQNNLKNLYKDSIQLFFEQTYTYEIPTFYDFTFGIVSEPANRISNRETFYNIGGFKKYSY